MAEEEVYSDYQLLNEKTTELQEKNSFLDELYAEWEELSES